MGVVYPEPRNSNKSKTTIQIRMIQKYFWASRMYDSSEAASISKEGAGTDEVNKNHKDKKG